MIVTTYTCDKCGHSQTKDEQMWLIGISIRSQRNRYSTGEPNPDELWCRPCIEKIGLLPPTESRKDSPPPELTLEDIVREIVREETS